MTFTNIKAQMCFLLGSNSGTAPDDYSTTDQARNINEYYRRAVDIILQHNNLWEFSDTTATADLTASTNSYQLSAGAGLNISDLIQIKRVEISYDGTNYYRATPININNIEQAQLDSNFESSAGLNVTTDPKYVLREDYIDIYPTPTANVTNGIKLYYTQNITDLSADGDVPLIPKLYHKYLALGGAYDYAVSRGLANVSVIKNELLEMEKQLADFMGIRNEDEPMVLTTTKRNYE